MSRVICLDNEMSEINPNLVKTTSEATRRIQIENQIKVLNNEITNLEEEKKAIEDAMEQVETLSSSSSLSSAGNSFTWIVNNMDTYWSATESSARDTVKDTLTKVSKECGESGKLLSQVGPIMTKAEEKISELTEEIEQKKLEVERLKVEQNSMIA